MGEKVEENLEKKLRKIGLGRGKEEPIGGGQRFQHTRYCCCEQQL